MNIKGLIFAVLVFLGSFVGLIFLGFYVVILFAGPHSDILPESLKVPFFLIVLLFVFILPSWLAYKTYRKIKYHK